MEENFNEASLGDNNDAIAQKAKEAIASVNDQLKAALTILEDARNNTNTSDNASKKQSSMISSRARSCLRSASNTCRYMQLMLLNSRSLPAERLGGISKVMTGISNF
jgi:hypothetical protein